MQAYMQNPSIFPHLWIIRLHTYSSSCSQKSTSWSYRYEDANNEVPYLLDKDWSCDNALTQTAGSIGKSSDDRSASPFVQDANRYEIGFALDADLACYIRRVTQFGQLRTNRLHRFVGIARWFFGVNKPAVFVTDAQTKSILGLTKYDVYGYTPFTFERLCKLYIEISV